MILVHTLSYSGMMAGKHLSSAWLATSPGTPREVVLSLYSFREHLKRLVWLLECVQTVGSVHARDSQRGA